jgi:hypothetical protein
MVPASSFLWDNLGIVIFFAPNEAGANVVRQITVYFRSIDDPKMSEFTKDRRRRSRTPKRGFPKRFFMQGAVLEPGRFIDAKNVQRGLKAGVDFDPGSVGTWTYRSMSMRAESKTGAVILGSANIDCGIDPPDHDGAHRPAFDEISFRSER